MHHRAHPGLGLSSASSSSGSSQTPTPIRSLNVFNPKILDASVRDVTAGLSDEQKADVLLYAMSHLELERSVAAVRFLLSSPVRVSDVLSLVHWGRVRGRSRTLIENAVQSCLSISRLPAANAAKARLMRARARLAAGLRVGARQGRSRPL